MNKRRFAVCVPAIILAVTGILSGAGNAGKVKATDYSVSNPRIDSEGNVIWDCAYFGSYYSTAEYEMEPIKWRVLHIDENDNALIMADRNIDCKNYNETKRNITWEECTLRSWLNGYGPDYNADGIDYRMNNFIDTAFTEEEQNAINTAAITNADNTTYKTKGGNDTQDKIYLLSLQEIGNADYGFDKAHSEYCDARKVTGTDYAKSVGKWTGDSTANSVYWWLRSPGMSQDYAGYVNILGQAESLGYVVNSEQYGGVRPVMQIDLKKESLWSDAGTTDSEGNDGISDGILNGPVIENAITTWDCIYFGKYNQTAKWTMEPIKWRVLSVEGNDAFLMADKNLDCRPYNEAYFASENVTWDRSTLRSWLNGYDASANMDNVDYSTDNFIDTAFTEKEKEAIISVSETDTEDKIYLLSAEEVMDTAYGFDSTFNNGVKFREVQNTEYAKVRGAYSSPDAGNAGNSYWWLRSPGSSSVTASYVHVNGNVGNSVVAHTNFYGVRPVLHVDLSSDVWDKAEPVTLSGENADGNIAPTATPEAVSSSSSMITKPSDNILIITPEPVPVQTEAPTYIPQKNKQDKRIKILSFKIKKKKITGKLSVSKASVKIKIGKKAWKKAKVNGKKFSLKISKPKKNTKVQIKIIKKGCRTLKKRFRVK